mmetsp:Transcript_8523/g.14142  ORF Transcript_8523/g.14142 Transcript_8523/m.14142 type:complete len:92 (+) Transcript_8523:134-409(+)
MNVTVDPLRLLHLALLLGVTYAVGQLLMHYFEDWTPLAAYGLGVTIVCQLSSAFMKTNNTADNDDDATKQEGNKIQGNPKKKKRSKTQKES